MCLHRERDDLMQMLKLQDFECSVCMDEMKPPVKIFQCRNGHVMCETCKDHPEVLRCPTCRMPLQGMSNLMRNIPMEKLARTFYEINTRAAGGGGTNGGSRPHSRGSISSGPGNKPAANSTRNVAVNNANLARMDSGNLSQSSENAFLEWAP